MTVINYEPGSMVLHRGELTVAQDIVRKLRELYRGTDFGNMINDIFYDITAADKELTKMTDEKNRELIAAFKREIEVEVVTDVVRKTGEHESKSEE